jgi:RNA polymerase sigma-70 factor, ECF subfamily
LLVNPTSLSLLDRLKVARPEASDWSRLQEIYLPLIERWLSRVPGLGDESADLAQDVLVVVFREVPRFTRQREGSFRAWLRQVTVNKVRNYRRKRQRRPAVGLDQAEGFLERLSDPNGDLAREWDRDHDQQVVQKLLGLVKPAISAMTWAAFQRFAVDGIPAVRVAEELGLSENAVILAKARVLKRLRQEAGELL